MSQEIIEHVKEAYTRVANSGAGCGCGPTACGSPAQDWTLSESYSNVAGYEEECRLCFRLWNSNRTC